MFVSLATVVQLLITYRYVVLFPIAMVEGPIVTILAGFLASLGYLDTRIVYPVVVLADLVGDSAYYALGFWGRERVITRWGYRFGITLEKVKSVEERFAKHWGKTLMLGKLSHAIGFVFLVAAGVARVPFGSFLWFNFLGTVPKSLVLLVVGFYFGQAYVQLNTYVRDTAFVMVALALLFVASYVVLKRASRTMLKKTSR